MDVTASPIFLPTVPERNPRTLCAIQPVVFISSCKVAPSGRFSRSRIFAALLPSRAPSAFFALLGAFLGALAFGAAFPFLGATCARFWPTRAFLVAFGSLPVAVAWAVRTHWDLAVK